MEEVDVIRRFFDIIKFYNILIFDGLHDLDLVFEGVVKFLCVFFDATSGDGLDSYEIAISNVSSFEDLTVGTSTDFLVDVDDEGLHKFVVAGAQFGSLLLYPCHFRFIHY